MLYMQVDFPVYNFFFNPNCLLFSTTVTLWAYKIGSGASYLCSLTLEEDLKLEKGMDCATLSCQAKYTGTLGNKSSNDWVKEFKK